MNGQRVRRAASRAAWIFVLVACASAARAVLPAGAELPPEAFDRHPARLSFAGVPTPPRFDGNSEAQRFRTVIRDGARRGPNFAGHYTVVTWGCGSGCQSHAIVDARTGAVFMLPTPTSHGVRFRRDSQLLVLDAAEECLDPETVGPTESGWFVWTGRALRKVGSRRIVAPCDDGPVPQRSRRP